MAVRVNGDLIPDEAVQYELTRLVKFYAEHVSEQEIRKQMPELQARAREQAIGAKLLMDEALKLDFNVSDEKIEAKLQQVIKDAGGQQNFDELLKKQCATVDQLRTSISQGVKVDMLVERVSSDVSDPTEEELEAHFNAHSEEYAKPERASAQHILIKVEGDNEGNKATAKSKLEGIREAVSRGESFDDQAAMHSDCPSGKQQGGSLGWFTRGAMVPEFDAAVFSMDVGDLSGIIETQFGYHIIQKTGQEEAQPAAFEDSREKVRDFLRHVKRGEALAAFVNELKEKAVIEDVSA